MPTKTIPQITQELADGRRQPFEMNGKTKQGDIFYSDISLAIKLNRIKDQSAFSTICAELRRQDFYVHS